MASGHDGAVHHNTRVHRARGPAQSQLRHGPRLVRHSVLWHRVRRTGRIRRHQLHRKGAGGYSTSTGGTEEAEGTSRTVKGKKLTDNPKEI